MPIHSSHGIQSAIGRAAASLKLFEDRLMLTQADEENYGPELLDMSRRAALDALTPELQRLHAENQQLRHLQQRSQRAEIERALDQSGIDWRQVYSDPSFAQWLSLITAAASARNCCETPSPTATLIGSCNSTAGSRQLPVNMGRRARIDRARPQGAPSPFTQGRKSRSSMNSGASGTSTMPDGARSKVISSKRQLRAGLPARLIFLMARQCRGGCDDRRECGPEMDPGHFPCGQ